MPHVTFIHGLANKPAPDYLHALWVRKLFEGDGINLAANGVTTGMVYWADVLYASPDTNLAAYESANVGEQTLAEADAAILLDTSSLSEEDRSRLDRLAGALGVGKSDVVPPAPTESDLDDVRLERIPLPGWLRNRLMGVLVRDAHHYFLNVTHRPRPDGPEYRVRDEIRRRFVEKLGTPGARQRPHVVVSHSMGTVIAFDCLANEPSCPEIDHLITVGSPLGLDEVQDFFPNWKRDDGFPSEKLTGRWVNIFDHLDPVVGFDPYFSDDFRRKGKEAVEDVCEPNWGTWRHSISKYLQGRELRSRLAGMLGVEWP